MNVIISRVHRFLTKDKNAKHFINIILPSICRLHPEHEFIYLSYDNKAPAWTASNFRHSLIQIPVYGRLWKPKWLKFFINKSIAKEGAALLISLDPDLLQTAIPMCIILDQLTGKEVNGFGNATKLVAPSQYLRERLVKQGVHKDNIEVIKPMPTVVFQPVEWDERTATKDKYADGKEYFLFDGTYTGLGQVLNVLKAFSLFKKWQKSNMQLLILGYQPEGDKLQESLKTYKYRDDVKIIPLTAFPQERASITAAAMAMLYFPESDTSGLRITEALQCLVPIITHTKEAIEETGGEAVLYCEQGDVNDIADTMKRLYKDERLRAELVERARKRATGADPVKAWWHLIEALTIAKQ